MRCGFYLPPPVKTGQALRIVGYQDMSFYSPRREDMGRGGEKYWQDKQLLFTPARKDGGRDGGRGQRRQGVRRNASMHPRP
jgi:hypothetical protein